jgi:ADP-heptose:LPS heptosyltransferase
MELIAAPDGLTVEQVEEEGSPLEETAALIENLDLVISVDTMAAHLAGALAKPVWTLLAYGPDWRWMLGRETTPWYPTMRLFRQARPGDWQEPIARVRQAIEAIA